MNTYRTLSVLTVLFILTFTGAYAQQTSGSIRGTVTDETGGVLPGVDITARNTDTGITRVVISDDEGRYRLPQLALGTYQVRAELAGFQTAVVQGIVLSIVRESVVAITLRVGAITEQVIVSAETSLVNTTSASVGALVDNQTIQDLPLNGRDFIQLAALQEGVVIPTSARTSRTGDLGMKMTISGTRPNQTAVLLDGGDIKNYYGNTPGGISGSLLGVDTVREFQVITNSYAAEYGRFTGGVISAVTKSGTNEIHGSVFEYHRNSALDARNFFDRDGENPLERSDPPNFIRNQYGFTIGGPIQSDKTFFFGSYEGLRDRLTTSFVHEFMNQDAHNGLLPLSTLGDDYLDTDTGQPGCAPQNIIPSSAPAGDLCNVGIEPVVQPYLDMFPLPNTGKDFGNGNGEFISPAPEPANEDYFMVKVDHQLSDTDSFFVRYTFDWSKRQQAKEQYAYDRDSITRNQYVTLEEKHIFSPTVLNEVRFAFNRTRVHDIEILSGAVDIDPSLYLLPDRGFLGLIDVNSGQDQFGNSTREPQFHTQNLFQTMDNLVWTRGSHSMKMGVNWSHFQYNASNLAGFAGAFDWDSNADFLQDKPDTAIHFFSDPFVAGIRTNLIGIYFQDDLQVNPNLTLNLGVRYEFITSPTEVGDRLGGISTPSQTVPFCIKPEGATFECLPSPYGRSYFRNPSLKNFSPRLGIAWDPTGSGKTSIRVGFGLFHDQLLPWLYTLAPFRGEPFAIQSDWDRDEGDTIVFPTTLRDTVATDRAVQVGNSVEIMDVVHQPYLMQWNLSLQQEIAAGTVVTATYSGSKGVHIARLVDTNLPIGIIQADGRRFFPPCSGRGCTPLPDSQRPNKSYGAISGRQWDGDSSYHGLKLGLKKRFSSGFSYQLSYAFQKYLDNGSGYTGSPGDFVTSSVSGLHPLDSSIDKGPSAWHTPQTFSANASLDLPFGPGRRFGSGATGAWGKVIEGWRINTIVTLADGPAVNIEGSAGRTCASCSTRPDLIPGADNSPNTGDPNQWFGAVEDNFAQTERGYFGNLGRNTGVGPGLATVDFSILKNISMGETASFQFRTELFNVFNRTNLHAPERTRGAFGRSGRVNGSFGQIRNTATTSRQIQFAMKILF